MANRSYLYACDAIPGHSDQKPNFIDLSEWNWDIPLVYKLLLSVNPVACKSTIWDFDGKIAIAGDYDAGLKKLSDFLSNFHGEEAVALRKEALDFLGDESNKSKYFVLECGEIFDMGSEDLVAENEFLLNEISTIDAQIAETLEYLSSPQQAKQGFFAKLFGKQEEAAPITPSSEYLYELGLGNWSNVLYFTLGDKE